jgi:hypothetical protein
MLSRAFLLSTFLYVHPYKQFWRPLRITRKGKDGELDAKQTEGEILILLKIYILHVKNDGIVIEADKYIEVDHIIFRAVRHIRV